MKIKNNAILCVFALTTLAATFGSCRSEDDVLNSLPQGSIPLTVGEVTVAGMKTNTRSSAGRSVSTRMSVTENAKGYTGIRKSTFVDGDELALVLSNDDGATSTTVAATLTSGTWVLDKTTYVIPGTTTIKATHTAVATVAGTNADDLEATTYTLTGQKVAFAMKHANAMIDITIPAGVTVTKITATAHNGTADETLTTIAEDEADGTKHYRTIVLTGTTSNPGTVKSITAVINGVSYVATLATPLTVEANKKYPIALTFKENKLTASVGAAALDWGMGGTTDVFPSGYTRIIRTPEDLAQFAKDMNDQKPEAVNAIVLQVADLDMSQLMTATEANAANPGKNYTYTATADNWVPIGGNATVIGAFKGTYNGNGHTIANVKQTAVVNDEAGFFGYVNGATLTGIHLRNIRADITKDAQNSGLKIGALAVNVTGNSIVTLCSATGSLRAKVTGGSYNQIINMGGLFSYLDGDAHITRCSADVNLWAEATDAIYLGGFAAEVSFTLGGIVGCSSTGNLDYTTSTNFYIGGFVGVLNDCNTTAIVDCYCSGTLKDNTACAFVGDITDAATSVTLAGCYSTSTTRDGSNLEFAAFSDVYADFHHISDCAYTDTPTAAIPGVTGNVAAADLYTTVTASNAALADVKTLHWSKADGYTLTEVTRDWYATDVWKDNGTAAPTLDLTYEGWDGTYEGQTPNLLEISGLTAYYVAPVNAKNAAGAEKMSWDEAMAANVCPAGWKVPTKDEFVAMTGIKANAVAASTNYDAIKAAFPVDIYHWSSTEDDDCAYYLGALANGRSLINSSLKGNSEIYRVRCVRKK